MAKKTDETDAFLSYTRIDDEEGEISNLRRRLSRSVQQLSGEPFVIFQDIDDRVGIGLGERWKGRLDEALDDARFFIPILTPSFFASDACRQELRIFLDLEKEKGLSDLVLPIYWIDCSVLEEKNLLDKDELAKEIDKRHRWDLRDLRFGKFDTEEGLHALSRLAKQIANAKQRSLIQTGLSDSASPISNEFSEMHQFVDPLSKAFPMEGRTRLVYTCRSGFEKPTFICPSTNMSRELIDSKTIPMHIPVDEIETLAPILNAYGDHICGENENQIKFSFLCSKTFEKVVEMMINDNSVDDILLDNIIFIGENDCSNKFIRRFIEGLYFRHRVRVEILDDIYKTRADEYGKEYYKIGMQFFQDRDNILSEYDRIRLLSEETTWGLINYVANPFASDKKMLFLLGKHRHGQMMLLDWIRNQDFEGTLEKIASDDLIKNNELIQVLVYGDTNDYNAGTFTHSGKLLRNWKYSTLRNHSDKYHDPYFVKRQTNYGPIVPGGQIADLSLIVDVESDIGEVKNITDTMPDELKPLLCLNDLHITIYEFMHHKGHLYKSIIDQIMREKNQIFSDLNENLELLPDLHIRLRQSKFTEFSLHINVDLSFSDKFDEVSFQRIVNLFHRERFPYMSPLDIIAKVCEDVIIKQSAVGQDEFNIMALPRPLHMTIARFDDRTSERQRELARQWASEQRNKVWGTIPSPRISLASFKEFPVGDSETKAFPLT